MSFPSTSPATPSPLASSLSRVSIIKTQKMSITQTYFLAHKARAKLSHEAAMPDHNLRLLVGHANLLDSLMLELADAEREQESWFNQSVRNASQHDKTPAATKPAQDRHIQWADAIAEEDDEEDDYDSSSDDDSDMSSDEDVEMADAEHISLRRVASRASLKAPASPQLDVVEVDMEDYEDDDYEENYPELALNRTPSHHSAASPPPGLDLDEDESSEDESMPPSPPTTLLPTFEPQKGAESPMPPAPDFFDDAMHYVPATAAAHNPTRLVSAISVY